MVKITKKALTGYQGKNNSLLSQQGARHIFAERATQAIKECVPARSTGTHSFIEVVLRGSAVQNNFNKTDTRSASWSKRHLRRFANTLQKCGMNLSQHVTGARRNGYGILPGMLLIIFLLTSLMTGCDMGSNQSAQTPALSNLVNGTPQAPPAGNRLKAPVSGGGVKLTAIRFEPGTDDVEADTSFNFYAALGGSILKADLNIYDQDNRPAIFGTQPFNPVPMLIAATKVEWFARLSAPTKPGTYHFILSVVDKTKTTINFKLDEQTVSLKVHAPSTNPTSGLVAVKDGSIWVRRPDGTSKRLTFTPPGGYAKDPAWSNDGSAIVYSYSAPIDPNDPTATPGSDIYIWRAGKEPQLVSKHPKDGDYHYPAWTPDDKNIIFSVEKSIYNNEQFVGNSWEVDSIPVSGGQLSPLIPDGSMATFSADGQHIIYLEQVIRPDLTWNKSIVMAGPDGKNKKVILPGSLAWYDLVAPRLSPDGQTIVFGGSRNYKVASPTQPASGLALPGVLAAPLQHGPPWELWTIPASGGDPHKLTSINEDTPTPAWSHDGKKIAFIGFYGFWYIDASGNNVQNISNEFDASGISWLDK